MYLDIITPDKKVFSGEVASVTVPGIDGQFQVLNNHAAIISSLGNGPIKVNTGTGETSYMTEGGVVEVLKNKVIVLVERVLNSEEGN